MIEYKIILTWEAIYDVAEIAEYIEENFSERDADVFQKNISEELIQIALNTKIYPKTHIVYRGYDIYRKLFKLSLIFYIIKEEDKEIHILRIMRSSRNWGNILLNADCYTYPE